MLLTVQPHYPDNEEQASSVATMIFHVFAFGSYASGLLGAALADSKAGLHCSLTHLQHIKDISTGFVSFRNASHHNKIQANTAQFCTLGFSTESDRPFLLWEVSALAIRTTWNR